MSDYRIIDADGHVMELDSELQEFIGPPYKDLEWHKSYSFWPGLTMDGYLRSLRKPGGWAGGGSGPNAQDWLRFLDINKIELTVLYPTQGLTHGAIQDHDWAICMAKAYNDWIHNKFMAVSPRLVGVALLPIQDIGEAVKELRRAVKRYDMVGGILPADGLQAPLGHKQYWPVYREADKLGCVLSVHSCNSLRDNDRYLVPNEAAALTHVIPQMRQFTNIMFSGVMNRLRKLRLGFLEAGSGWTAYLIDKIEDRLRRVPPAQRPALPSELLARKQLYFQCGEESTTKRDIELLGDDCLLWASDFPHEATRTDMKKLVKEHFTRKDLSPAAKKKIIYDNAKRFYNL